MKQRARVFSHRSGFTFIEIMVTTAIIAVLMGIVTISFQGANRNARDARRQTDMQLGHSALEKYRLEQGTYPGTAGQTDSSADGIFLSQLQPDYLSSSLTDPSVANENYYYQYQKRSVSGCNYVLIAKMEGLQHAKACPSSCGLNSANNDYCVAN